jgi:hypothetical protein
VCNLCAEVTALRYSPAIEEFLAVRHIELSQESDGKMLTVDMPA